jgi:hypothetical protein
MIAGADAGPLRQVPRTGEPAHVSAYFGDHGVDDQPIESRNRPQQLFGRLEGLGARVDLFGQRRDGGVEEVDVVEDAAGGDRVVRAEVPGQRLGQFGDLRPQLASARLATAAGSRWPSMSAWTISLPDWVNTLEATEVSFTPASWSIFSRR